MAEQQLQPACCIEPGGITISAHVLLVQGFHDVCCMYIVQPLPCWRGSQFNCAMRSVVQFHPVLYCVLYLLPGSAFHRAGSCECVLPAFGSSLKLQQAIADLLAGFRTLGGMPQSVALVKPLASLCAFS